MKNVSPTDAAALEALETREWIESLDYVLSQSDRNRTLRLLEALRAREDIAAFLKWIADKPPDFHAPTHRRR